MEIISSHVRVLRTVRLFIPLGELKSIIKRSFLNNSAVLTILGFSYLKGSFNIQNARNFELPQEMKVSYETS